MSRGWKKRVVHGMRVTSLAVDMIAAGAVGAMVALAFAAPPGGSGGVLLVVAALFAVLVAPAVAGIRAAVEDAWQEHAGAQRAVTISDVTTATGQLRAEQASLMTEVRALRAEVAQLRRPWWKRWRGAR